MFQYIDSVYNLVNEAQTRHFQKWPILGINVGTPEVGAQPLTYDGEISKFKNWIKTRLTWLDANMPGTCTSEVADLVKDNHFIRVFPNPASDVVYIESGMPFKSISLTNVAGKIILSMENTGNSGVLETSGLAAGLYFVTVYLSDYSSETIKLIIE
jgi:hypothetical protein